MFFFAFFLIAVQKYCFTGNYRFSNPCEDCSNSYKPLAHIEKLLYLCTQIVLIRISKTERYGTKNTCRSRKV